MPPPEGWPGYWTFWLALRNNDSAAAAYPHGIPCVLIDSACGAGEAKLA
jgi:hypothetical protein